MAHGQNQGQGVVNEDEPSRDELRENGFVEIDADGVQAMFNGNEADRITAQKFQSEVLKTMKQNGKVVYMVGQATAQWWLSSEMQKRRRAAARRMLDIGGAVASSAGNVIMNNTPIGEDAWIEVLKSNGSIIRDGPLSQGIDEVGPADLSVCLRSAVALMGKSSRISVITGPINDDNASPNKRTG